MIDWKLFNNLRLELLQAMRQFVAKNYPTIDGVEYELDESSLEVVSGRVFKADILVDYNDGDVQKHFGVVEVNLDFTIEAEVG